MIRHRWPILLVAVIIVAHAPLIAHPSYLVYPRGGQATDLTITHWPAVAFNVDSLRRHGQVPLWRTTIASGGPWVANPQSWLLYPPDWLFLVPGMPINVAFNVLLLAHLLLAGLATYALGRRALGLTAAGSTLAGLAFSMTPWLSGQLAAGHVNVVMALAWAPVALLASYGIITTGRFGWVILAGLAGTATLLNHFQIAAFSAGLTLAWSLFLLWGMKPAHEATRPDRFQGAQPGRAAGLLLVALIIALLLCAVLLVPLAEALPYLNRGTLTAEEAGILSLTWPQLLTVLIPTYGGEPEQAVYVGLPVALLAILALVLKRDRMTWFWVLASVAAILFALGTHGPLYPVLFRLVPGLSWLRVPSRAWALAALALALLAGRGLDVMRHPSLSRMNGRLIRAVGLMAVAGGLALTGGLAFLYRPVPPAVWILGVLTVLTVAALWLRTRSVLRAELLSLVLLTLAAMDLGLARAAWTEMRAPADAFSWGSQTAEALAGQPGQFRVYSPSYSLPQHTAFQYGLSLADGVDPFQLSSYASFLAQAGGYEAGPYSPTLPPQLDDRTAQPDAARLGLLNVGYVAASFPIEVKGLVPQARLQEAYLYRNEQMLPRAFVLAQPSPSSPIHLAYPIEATPARITTYTPNYIVMQADLPEPGLLVLSEVWYPGWRALDNGKEAAIERVEGVLRGVYLGSGSHRVELRYSPWTVWAGLTVSACTTLGLLTVAASRLRRRS